MLSKLRDSLKGWFGKIIFTLILMAFSFFGIESYMVSQIETGVAKVGDTEIGQDVFRQRFDEYRQQMMQMMGDQADGSFFQRPEVKRQVLDGIVDQTVIEHANDKLGLVIPNQSVFDEIAAIPAFQKDGKFDPGQYRAILFGQGMSPAALEERVRKDLATRVLPVAIATSAFVTDAELDVYLSLRDQLRDFRYITLDKPKPLDASGISEADIAQYYEANKAQFRTQEQVAIEYIDLQGSQLPVDLTPSDETLRERYEKDKARYVSAEQRQASHILVKVADKGGPDAQKAALARAETIAKEIADGKDFNEVAKEQSDDLGSKALGGDLGWLDQGLTEPAFDEALFALKDKNDVSAPVLTAEGYHIIKLTDFRPGNVKTFEEVKDELARQFSDSERERVFNEAATKLTDLTYEDPSSLENAARELKLTVIKSALFPRSGGADPITSNPAIVKAAFSDEVLVQGNNSDPIALSPERTIVLRKTEHKAAADRPLAEVSDQVRGLLVQERSANQAKLEAEAVLARLRGGEALDAVAESLNLKVEEAKATGRQASNVDAAVVARAFALPAPAAGKPDYDLVSVNEGAYAVLALDSVSNADISKLDVATRTAARDELRQSLGGGSARDLVAALRKKEKITISEERLQQ